MVPALLHGGSPGYSDVLSPYFSLIWCIEVSGKLSYSVFMDMVLVHMQFLCTFGCIGTFFAAYQRCEFSSIMAWVKKGFVASVVTGHTFFSCLTLNTRTKFLCNNLHEHITVC